MDTQNAPAIILGPDRVGVIQILKPESSGAIKLTPETDVHCIHRGREPYTDTFDSRHYVINPGFFTVAYGAALHFKARAVVPGSRNPETNFQASFIAILGIAALTPSGLRIERRVDDVEQFAPFTDDECREYGLAVEALDRQGMVDPIDAAVDIVPTRGMANEAAKVRSRVKGGADASRSTRKTQLEGPGVAALQVRNAAGVNEAVRQIAAGVSE